MSNSCIRVLADPVQIQDCRDSIEHVSSRLSDFTKVYNLAGNPARLKILFLLHKEGKMCPCDLSDVLDISVGGVSQHLRKLKDGGLVKDKKVGQTIFYSIVSENTQLFKTVMADLLKEEGERELAS